MKDKIKRNAKTVTGLLILAIALTILPAIGHKEESQANPLAEESLDEEPHIRPEDAEELILFEESPLSRRQTKTPGLIPEIKAFQHKSEIPAKPPKRELIDNQLRKQNLQVEKEAENKESEREEAESKETQSGADAETQAAAEEEPRPQATPDAGSQFLIQIEEPDPNYQGCTLQVSDRQTLEGLVMGEWGNDYLGAVLVAQCIRDSMLKEGTNSTAVIKRKYGYTAAIKRNVSNTVKQAVAFVFDQGGSGVQHPIYYFYASNLARGKWHETQKFVVQRKAVRFFSPHR